MIDKLEWIIKYQIGMLVSRKFYFAFPRFKSSLKQPNGIDYWLTTAIFKIEITKKVPAQFLSRFAS